MNDYIKQLDLIESTAHNLKISITMLISVIEGVHQMLCGVTKTITLDEKIVELLNETRKIQIGLTQNPRKG